MESVTNKEKYTYLDKDGSYFRLKSGDITPDILTNGAWVRYTGSAIDVQVNGMVIDPDELPELKQSA